MRVMRLRRVPRRVYTRELFALFQDQGLISVAVAPKTECGAVV